MVTVALEGEKSMDRLERRRVGGDDAQLASARQGLEPEANQRVAGGHVLRSGDVAQVDECRCGEVAAREGALNGPEMIANRPHTGCVVPAALELDPPAVGEIVESVNRGILVDAHRSLATPLHRGEAGILRNGEWRERADGDE